MAETTIITETFDIASKSDIHMTFSAYLQATAALTLAVKTYTQEGSTTSVKTFTPQQYFSGNFTISYNEKFESVSAGETTITVTMDVTTGTATIDTAMCSMNIIVFPLSVTSTMTATITV